MVYQNVKVQILSSNVILGKLFTLVILIKLFNYHHYHYYHYYFDYLKYHRIKYINNIIF